MRLLAAWLETLPGRIVLGVVLLAVILVAVLGAHPSP